MDEKKYSQLYQALLQEVLQFHSGNQRRIRKGMLSLLLVPLVFLVLLFLSEGSRVIFLLLWIVSMFGIAAYLIAVEYIDYEMQNKVKQITKKEVELDQLTPLPSAQPQLLPRCGAGVRRAKRPRRSCPEELAPEEPAPAEPCPPLSRLSPACPAPSRLCPGTAGAPAPGAGPDPVRPAGEQPASWPRALSRCPGSWGRISRSMGDQDRRSREVQS